MDANFISYPVAPRITRVSTMGERTVEQLLEELRMGRDLCTKEVGDIMWDAADEIERLRATLAEARQFINDWGPDEPGEAASRTNDMLAKLAEAMRYG